MSEGMDESASSAKVKDLIFAYERQSSYMEPLEEYEVRKRAKSIGNALSYKLFRQSLEIHNVIDIEKELVKIEAHLNYYETYEKETHVAFQEQLFNVLTSIVSIDPEGHESTIQKKKDLISETQKLARILNSKLPFGGKSSYRNVKRAYSSVVRRDEAIVSTTSTRTQEHKSILSSSHSTLNGGFMSEESLNSTRESLDLSARPEETSASNVVEVRLEPATPPNPTSVETQESSSYVPSVSKLKKFFSFRRNDRSDLKVLPAAYSGVSRSQSLNLKTNKFTIFKRERSEEQNNKIIIENDEDTESNHEIITSSPINEEITRNLEISLYEEPVKEIEEYREMESQHSVSVSKLKGIFEDKHKETEEGLGLLTTKKQTEFKSDFDLPYTEANLGAFRLKRTISGNYMNFTGLLRNIDIHKKSDLNKSKSMSDLKSHSFRHEVRDIEIDNIDLSKEIDDDDDDDFVHVSITAGNEEKGELEPNNNVVQTETHKELQSVEREAITRQSSETFVIGKVDALKKSFESRNTTEYKHEDHKPILHRIIDPIPNPNSPEEPFLKVPIQLRTGFTHVSSSSDEIVDGKETLVSVNKEIIYHEDNASVESKVESASLKDTITTESNHVVKEEENSITGTVETLKQTFEHLSKTTGQKTNEEIKEIIHRTIEPITSASSLSDEPYLKVPIQLRIGAFSDSKQESKDISSTDESSGKSSIATILDQTASFISAEQNSSGVDVHKSPTITSVEIVKQSCEYPSEISVIHKSNSITNLDQSTRLISTEQNQGIIKSSNVSGGMQEVVKQSRDQAASLISTEKNSSSISVHKSEKISTGSSEIIKQAYDILNKDISSDNLSSSSILDQTASLSSSEQNLSSISVQQSENISTGSAEVVKQTYESHSTSNSTENDTQPEITVYEVSEPETDSSLEQKVTNVPLELKRGFASSVDISHHLREETSHLSESSKTSLKNNVELTTGEKVISVEPRATLTVTNVATQDKRKSIEVPKSLFNGSPKITEQSEYKEYKTLGRAQISSNTESLMEILDSPTSFSTITSSSSIGQSQHASSSSKTVTYSQKQRVQQTSSSTTTSRRIISSSSSTLSDLSSMSYLQVIKDPNSYSILTKSPVSSEESSVIITSLEDSPPESKLKVKLTESKENILDEVLNDSDSFDNVDEEFEKILEEIK